MDVNKMLELRILQKDGISRIYEAHLVNDFDKAEVKPLSYILEKVEEGSYVCFGAFEAHQLVGYVFLSGSKRTDLVLLDYLAVVSDKRGLGYGSKILQELQISPYNKAGILLEVEHIKSAKNPEDRQIRKRRIAFYMKNGLEETSVQTIVGGVHFLILFMQKGNPLGALRVAREMQILYEDLLGSKIKYQIW